MAADPQLLKVSLHRSGGLFAGDELAISVVAAELDDQSRETLERHLEQVDVEEFAKRSPIVGPGADMYQYDLIVERGGKCSHIVVSQTAVPNDLQPLVEWLETRAAAER